MDQYKGELNLKIKDRPIIVRNKKNNFDSNFEKILGNSKVIYLDTFLRGNVKYNNNIYSLSFFLVKLSNFLIFNGKFFQGYKFVEYLFRELKILGKIPSEVLSQVVEKLLPVLDIKTSKRKRKLVKYPGFITYRRSLYLGITWLLKAAKVREEHKYFRSILLEILDIYNDKGLALNYKKLFYLELTSLKPFLKVGMRLFENNKRYVK